MAINETCTSRHGFGFSSRLDKIARNQKYYFFLTYFISYSSRSEDLIKMVKTEPLKNFSETIFFEGAEPSSLEQRFKLSFFCD